MMNYSQLFLEIFNELQQIEDRGVATISPSWLTSIDHFGSPDHHRRTSVCLRRSEVRFSIRALPRYTFACILAGKEQYLGTDGYGARRRVQLADPAGI